MKVGLDTSVVLRLLTGQPEDQAERAVAFLDALARRGDRAVVSDLVVAETYFALQHHYHVPKNETIAALRRLFDDGEVESEGVAPEVLALGRLASARPGLVDRLIHGGYLTGAGGMATFEKASERLDSVKVL
jgi:predicted nucleic acid-binding protein